MAPPSRYRAPGPRGQNAFQDEREDKERDAEYAKMLEERRRWRAASLESSMSPESLALAGGALAPLVVAMPGLAAEIGKDALAAGAVGGAASAYGQARRGGVGAINPQRVAKDAFDTMVTSPIATVGGRIAGLPGEATGAYANARASGASHEEAMWAAGGAAIAHPFGHGKLEGWGAAAGRKFFQAWLGNGVSDIGAQSQRRQR